MPEVVSRNFHFSSDANLTEIVVAYVLRGHDMLGHAEEMTRR